VYWRKESAWLQSRNFSSKLETIPMKMIRCYIRYEKLEEVREKLFILGVPGLSVSEVKGIGKPLSQMGSNPDGKKVPQFQPRVELTIVLEKESVDEVVDALVSTLRTGNLGDGKIFILPVEEAIRVRTGDRGDQALY
jgi:nitrogen regulatory protein P-II 1